MSPDALITTVDQGFASSIAGVRFSRDAAVAKPSPFRMVLQRRHGDLVAPTEDGRERVLVTGGPVGTHIAHLPTFSGGKAPGDVARCRRNRRQVPAHGIDTVARGVPRRPARRVSERGYEITAQDLEGRATVRRSNGATSSSSHGLGKALGRPRSVHRARGGVPGPGGEGHRGSCHGPRAVGSDTIAFERVAPASGPRAPPATASSSSSTGSTSSSASISRSSPHRVCARGRLRSLPLKIVGGTGSPVRPSRWCVHDDPRRSARWLPRRPIPEEVRVSVCQEFSTSSGSRSPRRRSTEQSGQRYIEAQGGGRRPMRSVRP